MGHSGILIYRMPSNHNNIYILLKFMILYVRVILTLFVPAQIPPKDTSSSLKLIRQIFVVYIALKQIIQVSVQKAQLLSGMKDPKDDHLVI